MTAPAHHFTDVDCAKCDHPVFAHVGHPCCRECQRKGYRGMGSCRLDPVCPIDGLLASKHEGWITGVLPGQLSIDAALADVIPSRTTDPETSHAAAAEIKVRAGTQRAKLLDAHYRGNEWDPSGLTDEQAMKWAGVSATSEFAKRCSELREGGFIEPTGETRPGSAGPQRIVSRITPKGIAWIEANR